MEKQPVSMDDFLDEMIRDADPGTVHRGTPLSERGLRELAEYQAKEAALSRSFNRCTPIRPTRAHRRRVFAGAGAFLMMLAVAVLSLTTSLYPTTAIASTPPLLVLTPLDAEASATLKNMADIRRAGPGRGNTIRTQTWALNTSIGEDGTIEYSAIEPEWSETTFNADGSIHYLLIAAEPFPGQESKNLTKPGTILVNDTFSPEGWEPPFPEGPPADMEEVGDYLTRFTETENLTVGQTIQEISTILSKYLLDTEQEAGLIEYLSTLEGIDTVGSTHDRLGREGIVFRATDRLPNQLEDYLIVSPTTGQILAVETVYIAADRTDIETPSVISYTAWQY
ncbi:MAG: hypothetical protein QM705_03460 [Ancrocorticia sp.]